MSYGQWSGAQKHGASKSSPQKHKSPTKNKAVIKTARTFEDLEAQILSLIADPSKRKQLGKLWHSMDFNNNGICSLAEIDKFVVRVCARTFSWVNQVGIRLNASHFWTISLL